MTSFTIKTHLNASPEQVYNAWLDGDEHGRMTGGEAHSRPEEGSAFSAWDGYISGIHQKLVQDSRIVQTWRTTEFKDDDQDSIIEIVLEKVNGGTELTLTHKNIPDDQPDYKQGWSDHYFNPMAKYFGQN